MRIVFYALVYAGFCGNFFEKYGLAAAVPRRLHHIISKDLTDRVDEMYNSYFPASGDKSGNRVELAARMPQVYFDEARDGISSQPEDIKHKTLLLVKRLRQRDKRYISYLTLCHFKICNMGRKRTTRYFHMIKTMDDNGS